MPKVSLLTDAKDLSQEMKDVAWLLDDLGYKMVVNCSSTGRPALFQLNNFSYLRP
jgi:hypothetical protein